MMSLLCIAFFNKIHAQVAISEITASGEVEIINTSNETIDLSNYWLCDRPSYEQLGNLTVSCGDLNLAAGASVTVITSSITVNPAGDEMAIYSSSSFGSSTAIIDYVIWGNRSGSTREPTASQAGIWTTDQRAPAFSSTESLNWDGEGDAAADFETAEPSICSDNTGGGAECEVMGGTLTGGPFAFCVGDGEADNIMDDGIILTGNTGPNSQWVVTDDEGNILGLPPTFTAVNFDGAGAGTCFVWHLSSEDGLAGAEEGANFDDLDGCFSLSNPITVERFQPAGGTLTGGPFSFCVGDGVADNIAQDGITLTGNSGTNSQWVVTDDEGNILGLPPTFTAVDFDGAGVGTCLVWHLSFEEGLIGADVGANANDLQGCFNLSNPITVERSDAEAVCGTAACEAMGGTLTGGPFTFCAGDGVADNIVEGQVILSGNSGTNSQWIVTDDQGNILGLPPSFTVVDFDGAGVGVCSVWHLSYEDGLEGLAEGGNVTNFSGACYSLSNPIEVIRTDNPEVCGTCLLYTSPSPRDKRQSRMPSSA